MKEAIELLIRQYRMDDKVAEMKIQEIWRSMMGNFVANKTAGFQFKKGELTIRLDSSALRQELSMNKTLVMENLNTELGGKLITVIHLK